jgi:hypothetical protein
MPLHSAASHGFLSLGFIALVNPRLPDPGCTQGACQPKPQPLDKTGRVILMLDHFSAGHLFSLPSRTAILDIKQEVSPVSCPEDCQKESIQPNIVKLDKAQRGEQI